MTELATSRRLITSTHQLMGRGLASPFMTTETGQMALAQGPEKIRQAIFTILETEPGERVMLPEFGCGLQRFIMEPNGFSTWSRMEHEVTQALNRFEPRIAVQDVSVTSASDPATAIVTIRYRHQSNGREDNLVFPFYFG